MKFCPDKTMIKELKEDIGKLLDKPSSSFFFAFLNYSYLTKKISDDDIVSNLRRRTKHQDLYALEYSEKAIEVLKEDNHMEIPIQLTQETKLYANSSSVRRPFTFIRPFYFKKNCPTKEIHYELLEYFRFLFEEFAENEEEKEEITKLNTEQLYEKLFSNNENAPYEVLVVTNSRGYFNCYFCGSKSCKNCSLPFDNEILLENLLSKIESQYHDFELEVFWKNPNKINLERLGIEKEEDNNKQMNMKKNKTIVDIETCLELFREPEKLGETEAWYCNVCKEHKQATKQMQIYTAPKILILHLKRFKTTLNHQYSMVSSGKISDYIKFPHKLDLTKYVLNKNSPQFFEENIFFDENGVVIDETNDNEKKEDIIVEKNNNEMEIENNFKNSSDYEKIEKIDDKKIEIEEIENVSENLEKEKIVVEEENNENNKDKIIYELFAVSNHFGSVGFGHYTAFAKNSVDGKWYNFDDSHVSETSPEHVVTDSAYLLFYKRC